MNSQVKKRKVFVGLSGGVDSAVSAALLQKAGYDVTGVFIKVWQPDWLECNWKEERREAMRVAAHLGIPFATLDLEKEYKEGVIDYMLAEYKAGRTPNPDVMCNREVKFGAFWRWAKSQGADYIATGHYARIVNHSLFAGKDKNKDQSYFLWTLNQDDLAHILFPIGHLEKPEVRKLARKFKLPNADKKDSQGLCFMGKINIKDFLAHYLKAEPGNVLNEDGEIIGKHQGALFFTIGERHGFMITKKTPDDDRYYVIDKDMEQNTITVSDRKSERHNSMEKKVRLGKVNWVIGSVWENSEVKLQARSRYRQLLENIKIVSVNISEITAEFERYQDALTPGQSLVIYKGEECVGGGIIVE
ncbi:MAG: tRNA 2-thiouridine(34) synthase MnmA [Patescibacteria group bacterium]